MKFNRVQFLTPFLCIAAVCSLLLTGCQSFWSEEPGFGDHVNDAVQQQTVNPANPQNPSSASSQGMDGVAAKDSIDNYQKSFETRTGIGAGPYPSTPLGNAQGGAR
jgi:hypothetical protein